MKNCDNPSDWRYLCNLAVALAFTDFNTKGKVPRTEADLMCSLEHDPDVGKLYYRNGHARALRAVYGGVINGLLLTNRALKQGKVM